MENIIILILPTVFHPSSAPFGQHLCL
ncbi:unnamed protein product [Blumeria hordei]|uniref:Uncharacterized protein n=1 Tax=Blumeria hordei TaxID=2867405 RepID=A0A383ULM1_BLUHO|nr:unnamed protein product [Blumeria hordei]